MFPINLIFTFISVYWYRIMDVTEPRWLTKNLTSMSGRVGSKRWCFHSYVSKCWSNILSFIWLGENCRRWKTNAGWRPLEPDFQAMLVHAYLRNRYLHSFDVLLSTKGGNWIRWNLYSRLAWISVLLTLSHATSEYVTSQSPTKVKLFCNLRMFLK